MDNHHSNLKLEQFYSKLKGFGVLPEGRSVVGNNDELGLAQSEAVEGLFVAQQALSGLHDEGQTRVDALVALLDLLLGSHFEDLRQNLSKV